LTEVIADHIRGFSSRLLKRPTAERAYLAWG
jgi:hypothetical protein